MVDRANNITADINNISFNYGKRSIFKDFSLDIPNGISLGILGGNGSGKTTLIKLIAGLEKAKKGNIKLLDVKTAQPQLHKKTGNNVTKGGSRSPEQVKIGVQLLQFEPDTRKLRFVEHQE